MTINAFPLTWPPTFPRAKQRESGRFKASLSSSLKNVQESLQIARSTTLARWRMEKRKCCASYIRAG
jgi:hypothetical protein